MYCHVCYIGGNIKPLLGSFAQLRVAATASLAVQNCQKVDLSGHSEWTFSNIFVISLLITKDSNSDYISSYTTRRQGEAIVRYQVLLMGIQQQL